MKNIEKKKLHEEIHEKSTTYSSLPKESTFWRKKLVIHSWLITNAKHMLKNWVKKINDETAIYFSLKDILVIVGTYHDNHRDYSGDEECTFVVLKGLIKFVKATRYIEFGVKRTFLTNSHLVTFKSSTTRFWYSISIACWEVGSRGCGNILFPTDIIIGFVHCSSTTFQLQE